MPPEGTYDRAVAHLRDVADACHSFAERSRTLTATASHKIMMVTEDRRMLYLFLLCSVVLPVSVTCIMCLELASVAPAETLQDKAVRVYTYCLLVYITLDNLCPLLFRSQRRARIGWRELLLCTWNLGYCAVGLMPHIRGNAVEMRNSTIHLTEEMVSMPMQAFWLLNLVITIMCFTLLLNSSFFTASPVPEGNKVTCASVAIQLALIAVVYVLRLALFALDAMVFSEAVDPTSPNVSLTSAAYFLLASYGITHVATIIVLWSDDIATIMRQCGLVEFPCVVHLSWVVYQCGTGSVECSALPESIWARLAGFVALACYVWGG